MCLKPYTIRETAAGLHIASSAMSKKDCPAGSTWESIVDTCVQHKTETGPEPGPTTDARPGTAAPQEAAPQHPLQKTEPPAEIHPPPPDVSESSMDPFSLSSPAPGGPNRLHAGTRGFTFCSGPSEHAWPEGPNMLREHRIPLPATELVALC
ncbi:hypothetical protein F7725_003830 [Dissostichus mawsoni]|uniref:Uncharacterized protein n=1 Tax=Dissostichus mawsoni TaxID=36200 RepID=A0A7J5YBA9_DISMA|nr:hypothetical protein F7725_003830 [Dissostichus mawsoni]